ncbi:uncharacterized protein LOC128911032 [Rissa tridactyla]|uniref:uncharacterized protein LOC128911032 n=1 Tax=Rissa tridactyla TaxID=75485 RepID=UPI0023BAEF48|nr:uncharacterized protein LOC128911032 [Rissa tridactyla]
MVTQCSAQCEAANGGLCPSCIIPLPAPLHFKILWLQHVFSPFSTQLNSRSDSRNNPPAGSCTYRTSGWALPNPQKTLISYTSLACNHEVIKDHQDKKLVARFTVPVAPGSHQKIEASAHLIAEVRSSLCSPAHGLLPGSGRKPGARSTGPAPPLASCIDSPLLPRDCNDLNMKILLDCLSFPSSWGLVSIRRGESRGAEVMWFHLQSLLLRLPHQPFAELAPMMLFSQTIFKKGFTETLHNLKQTPSFHLRVL